MNTSQTLFNFILLAVEVILLRVAQEVGIIPPLGSNGPFGDWGIFIIGGVMVVLFPLNLVIVAVIAAAHQKLRRQDSN